MFAEGGRAIHRADDALVAAFLQRAFAHDAVGAPAFLASNAIEIDVAQEQWLKIRFHALREHAGLIFHSNSALT